jgi:hypothetical protein
MATLAPCPICGSAAVEHPAEGLCGAGASCSNYQCILHVGPQDETNRHVQLEQWPKAVSDPVVLIGVDLDCGSLEVVGLYENTEAAQAAVVQRQVPGGPFYTVMTPKLGSSLERQTKTCAETYGWLPAAD